MIHTYSNPRLEAIIPDWPSGQYRTTATFRIESHPTRGQRGTRTTVDPKSGKLSAPKTLTYARQALIVDGDDGRTYIAELSIYGLISIMRGDMKYQEEVVYDSDPRYASIRAMFE